MAKTPRARKVSDATASGKPKPAKKSAAKPAAPAKGSRSPAGRATAAKKSDAKQRASVIEKPPAAKKAAKEKTILREQASASKKASKQQATAEPAPAAKKAAKKGSEVEAPAAKKAAKKTSKTPTTDVEAPASKKSSKKKPAAEIEAPAAKKGAKKKAADAEAPASKKASKKKAAQAPGSEQLAFSMDIDAPAHPTASAPASRGPLQPGDRVPEFTLEGDDGQTYSRQSLAGERFVLYFYPKDDTPGCTRQACDFRDNRPRFESASVKVLGVSGDTLKSHGRFRSKYELNFPLLADPERTVAQAFGAVGEKKLYGKTSIGIIRSTFLVGPDGVVEKTFSPVKVDGHAEAVLQAIGSA